VHGQRMVQGRQAGKRSLLKRKRGAQESHTLLGGEVRDLASRTVETNLISSIRLSYPLSAGTTIRSVSLSDARVSKKKPESS